MYTTTVTIDDPCTPPVPEVYIPNAFSPNGDNQNDILFVRGSLITEMQFQIFNRWGECVFESNDIADGWNGTWRGRDCESAVFTYVFRARLVDGSDVNRKGNISLIR